jgi:hypothetical protein
VAHGLVVEVRGMGVCEWQDCHVTCELIACGSVSDVMKRLLPMRQGQNIMCRVHVILCMVTMIVSCITQRRRLSARPCLSAALPNDSPPTFYSSATSYGHSILTSIRPLHSSYTTIAPSPPPTSTPRSCTAYTSRGASTPRSLCRPAHRLSLSVSAPAIRDLFG